MPSGLVTHCDGFGHNLVILTGVAVTTTSGTLSTATGENDCEGFTVAKTGSETGRYTATIADKYRQIQYAHCVIEGAADAAYTDQKGAVCMLRNVSASGKSADFQIMGLDGDGDFADREVEDGAKLRFVLIVHTGSV